MALNKTAEIEVTKLLTIWLWEGDTGVLYDVKFWNWVSECH